ncbi:hypothetical protein N9N38_02775 [Candidatus Pelagibacter bacterium]|nr:hypothetical protein [Candidatus Pelagibacter bacterium]MDA8841646.1 hypothetical protein [Candidatus Pelagibacter bacterium]
MKKIFLILLFTFLILNKGYAATATGEATEYEVTMKKVELCSDATCTTPIIVGERDMAADIAAADAGATVGNYASTAGIPSGTYSHIRITISRTIQITGSVVISDSSSCFTDGGTDNVADNLLVTTATSASSTTMYLVNDDSYEVGTGTTDSENITIGYTNPTYASSMIVSGDNAVMIYELTEPYTRLLKAPVIKIAFNTENAVGCEDTTADVMWIEEPYVSITIQ